MTDDNPHIRSLNLNQKNPARTKDSTTRIYQAPRYTENDLEYISSNIEKLNRHQRRAIAVTKK